ncbi:haloacid dehalogenase-like hydrolase [Rhexocercosporidium sp. MPI-PUGE-AT-0058]|nr:haloacid dehalogenase-like hydrolase [Rhexocercosporidium sp. MPI-PUGE-AT-0058]
MAAITKDFPPVRACLFDMDGLLIDSEEKYTIATNAVLNKYGRPNIPWAVKAKMQGRAGKAAGDVLHEWAQLPVSREQYMTEVHAIQNEHFPTCKPLAGVEALLSKLASAKTESKEKVHIALATSSHKWAFELKTAHLQDSLFTVFERERRILGDDTRIAQGRGKPSPDIYLLALKVVNETLGKGEREILPEECLVFEDSVPGVESGRRAGMRLVWVPHPDLFGEFREREEEVLAGRTGEAGDVDMHLVGELGDGWAERLETLEEFPYQRYGIVVS